MRIGIVGAGKIGKLRVQSVKEDPGTELVAVFDINEALVNAAIEGSSAKGFSNINAFMDVDMDAVIVSTPSELLAHPASRLAEGDCSGVTITLKQPLSPWDSKMEL